MVTYVLQNAQTTTGEYYDIVIKDGIISAIVDAGSGKGDQMIDCSNHYISSGWIDLHVHARETLTPYGDSIDEIGVKQGVTTIVDAGSCGADDIDELFQAQKHAKTKVYALLNLSRIGLQRIDELSNQMWLDEEKVRETIALYPDFIVGIKVRMSQSVVGELGIIPLEIASKLSEQLNQPLMIHIGSAPPVVEDILPLLKKNDVITHYLHGKSNSLFMENGEPKQVLLDAIQGGVRLDVGHGSASFSFETAKNAKKYHLPLQTISTDIYRGNRLNGPVYNMATTLTKFLHLGYSLQEVIDAVTVQPASWLGQETGIQVGNQADITIFSVRNESGVLVDSTGNKEVTNQMIVAEGVFVNGKYITC